MTVTETPNVAGAVETARVASHLHEVPSYDPGDFPVPTGREESWRFTPLKRLGGILEAGPSDTHLAWETELPEGVTLRRITTEEARALGPKQLIGEYKTDFAWDPDPGRQANLKMASKAIDNTLLAPGEIFSVTEQAGMIDYEKAKVFTDGGVGYEEGGGLCQVSSTLFMAANYAGLEIVERHPHYAELPYIKPGFDATVWFGDWNPMDMRFKNTTDGYVLVREFVDEDGYLNAQILGQKPTGNKVIMNTEKISQSTTEGIKWITYKKVIAPDGEVLFDDLMSGGPSTYSWNPPTPEALKHETNDPRISGWLDPGNTTGWSEIE